MSGSLGQEETKQQVKMVYIVNQAQPHVEEGRFLLSVIEEGSEPSEGDELHEVYLSLDAEGKPSWDNLPKEFELKMKGVPEEE